MESKSSLKTNILTIPEELVPREFQRLVQISVKTTQHFSFNNLGVYFEGRATFQDGIESKKGILQDLVEHSSSGNKPSIVYGRKTFERVVMKAHLDVPGLLNSVNLSSMADNAMFLETSQTIRATKSFSEMLTMQAGIQIDGEINGVRIDDFLNLANANDGTSTTLIVSGKYSQFILNQTVYWLSMLIPALTSTYVHKMK